MKPKLQIILSLLGGIAVGWVLCWKTYKSSQPYQPIEEAKICYTNLEMHSESMDPQLREFLKARLYSVSAQYIQEGWLDGWEIDFGPVDDSVLTPIYAIKNAASTLEVYNAALLKHPDSAMKNNKAKAAVDGNLE